MTLRLTSTSRGGSKVVMRRSLVTGWPLHAAASSSRVTAAQRGEVVDGAALDLDLVALGEFGEAVVEAQEAAFPVLEEDGDGQLVEDLLGQLLLVAAVVGRAGIGHRAGHRGRRRPAAAPRRALVAPDAAAALDRPQLAAQQQV